ncbi:MAG: hypothetical protein ACXWNK_06850 [Vulcanimicrobiaceae bacterium]
MRIGRALFGVVLLAAVLIGCTSPSGSRSFTPYAGVARHTQDSGGGIPGKASVTPSP